MVFWIMPGEAYTHRCRGSRLHVKQATLADVAATFVESTTIVRCSVGTQPPLNICALSQASRSVSLDLQFQKTQDVVFSVQGSHAVHLPGHYDEENDSAIPITIADIVEVLSVGGDHALKSLQKFVNSIFPVDDSEKNLYGQFNKNEGCSTIPFQGIEFPYGACFDPVRHEMIEKKGAKGVRIKKTLPLLLPAAGDSGMKKNKIAETHVELLDSLFCDKLLSNGHVPEDNMHDSEVLEETKKRIKKRKSDVELEIVAIGNSIDNILVDDRQDSSSAKKQIKLKGGKVERQFINSMVSEEKGCLQGKDVGLALIHDNAIEDTITSRGRLCPQCASSGYNVKSHETKVAAKEGDSVNEKDKNGKNKLSSKGDAYLLGGMRMPQGS